MEKKKQKLKERQALIKRRKSEMMKIEDELSSDSFMSDSDFEDLADANSKSHEKQ